MQTSKIVLIALALGLGLSSCADDAEPKAQTSAEPTKKPSSVVGLPSGVTLTEDGAELSYGETATVAFAATQTLSTVLELTVTKVRAGAVSDFKGFKLSDADKAASYFYADVSVKNLDAGDLGGRPVPLFGMSDADLLLGPVTIQSAFTKCPTKTFPKVFGEGRKMSTCLVFQVPRGEKLVGVAFRPVDSMDPVLWSGDVTQAPTKKKPQPNQTPAAEQ